MDSEERELLKDRIITLLKNEEANQDFIIELIEKYSASESRKNIFFSELLELFVHLQFHEKEAVNHWKEIIRHFEELSRILGRNVGIRVAMADYFYNLNRLLDHPMLIEIHLYKQTEKMAMVDILTGAFNRRYMEMALKKELNRCARYNKEMALVILDIDNFKSLNDSKGHIFGDVILKEISSYIREYKRDEDLLCRYGGEEFVIILPESSANGALNFIERIRKRICGKKFFKTNKVTFSAGIVSYPEGGKTMSQLLKNADRALYQAKYSGKNRSRVFESERREHERFLESWEFIYTIAGETADKTKLDPMVTQDISLGGIRFEDDQKIDIDTKLVFEIKPLKSEQKSIAVIGKIIWIKKLSSGRFSYGAAFYDLNREQIEKLNISLPSLKTSSPDLTDGINP